MKKIAIIQSNFIPWKGYFDLIAFVDEFILYDDVQYTKRDWRNRNKIKIMIHEIVENDSNITKRVSLITKYWFSVSD